MPDSPGCHDIAPWFDPTGTDLTEIPNATVGLHDPTFTSGDGKSTRAGAGNSHESEHSSPVARTRPIQGSMLANLDVPPLAIGDRVDACRNQEEATGSDHVNHRAKGDEEHWELLAPVLPIRPRCAQGNSPRTRAEKHLLFKIIQFWTRASVSTIEYFYEVVDGRTEGRI